MMLYFKNGKQMIVFFFKSVTGILDDDMFEYYSTEL